MGTIFHGNQPYSGGGVLNIVHKTWAQYKALSEAEKHDAGKYYFVPDAPAQGVPGVVAELQDEVDTINNNFAITSGSTNVTGATWVKMGKIATINFDSVASTSGSTITITGAPTPAVNTTFLCPLQNTNNIVGYCLIANKAITLRTTSASGYGSLMYFCE